MKNSCGISVGKIVIPTYPEPAAEEMPMFAENRVHQRTSGNPYPNKVVLEVNREEKIDREYTVVVLENEYLKIEILPEIGGRIYSAYDKSTGYDFFYKQHVIKPALIGALGSWISGGVEFNWPYHHRPSGFMPCDFLTETLPDGSAVCHISEHEPADRMQGTVSVILRPGEKRLETRMSLYNRTPMRKSFLWWENAAVPVDENYRIFFPPDVSYVNFHYLKSRITYPIAGDGIFNGIPMKEARDISYHKNTREATSYFASYSDYDFFGGYDTERNCGVVHIGDHHVSPGKKMFTWAYGQLSKSWEKALTDTDGQYAELMAGSYSDNQPNFSWLEPYETKNFSQYWYPISDTGCPVCATLDCALRIEKNENGVVLLLQSTRKAKNASICVKAGGKTVFSSEAELLPDVCNRITVGDVIDRMIISVYDDNGKTMLDYAETDYDRYNMPPVIDDMPCAAEMHSADELYRAGVHTEQYRDPAVSPDAYFREALKRDPYHAASLYAMAKYEFDLYNFDTAEEYCRRAIKVLTEFNERLESGNPYYIMGLILERKGDFRHSYDYYRKAAWSLDCIGRAMTRAAMLDLRNGNYENAVKCADTALSVGTENSLASCVKAIAQNHLGDKNGAAHTVDGVLAVNPLNHLARYLSGKPDFYTMISEDKTQLCLDIAFDLCDMGENETAITLLKGLVDEYPNDAGAMVYYTLYRLNGDSNMLKAAEKAPLGRAYPSRYHEIPVLKYADTARAKFLHGCLIYSKKHYAEADELWKSIPEDATVLRNRAVAAFSHLGRKQESLGLMLRAVELNPASTELVYETAVLMDKLNVEPLKKAEFISSKNPKRDDVLTELAKAYNQALMPKEALEVLNSHVFTPCEGGEHAIADEYMFAYLQLGEKEMRNGNYRKAAELFSKGTVLPENLGAGIWNHTKYVPLKYRMAIALGKCGNTDEANKIFEYIAGIGIEYFSKMHLFELPFYQALSLEKLGRSIEAQNLITRTRRDFARVAEVTDNGYYKTTPFFIPFMDDPKEMRRANALYLAALVDSLTGHDADADRKMKKSVEITSENLFAVLFSAYGIFD